MTAPSHNLLFLDFETTGLGDRCQVLEVFAEITDWDLTPAWSTYGISHVLHPMEPAVFEVHLSSGLVADIATAASRKAQSVADAMDGLHDALKTTSFLVPLAGSGVVFDQRIIDRQWPQIHELLTYWTVDVSPMRRMALGMGFDDLLLPKAEAAHRSEADVRRAQAEFRRWRDVFLSAREHGVA